MNGLRTVGPPTKAECVDCGWRTERKRDWVTFDLGKCRECKGAMRVRVGRRALAADAKAKRDLLEQGA